MPYPLKKKSQNKKKKSRLCLCVCVVQFVPFDTIRATRKSKKVERIFTLSPVSFFLFVRLFSLLLYTTSVTYCRFLFCPDVFSFFRCLVVDFWLFSFPQTTNNHPLTKTTKKIIIPKSLFTQTKDKTNGTNNCAYSQSCIDPHGGCD